MTENRPPTADERERLAPVLDETTIPVRVASAPIATVKDEQEPTKQTELTENP